MDGSENASPVGTAEASGPPGGWDSHDYYKPPEGATIKDSIFCTVVIKEADVDGSQCLIANDHAGITQKGGEDFIVGKDGVNGKDGKDGKNGAAGGVTKVVVVNKNENTNTVTVVSTSESSSSSNATTADGSDQQQAQEQEQEQEQEQQQQQQQGKEQQQQQQQNTDNETTECIGLVNACDVIDVEENQTQVDDVLAENEINVLSVVP